MGRTESKLGPDVAGMREVSVSLSSPSPLFERFVETGFCLWASAGVRALHSCFAVFIGFTGFTGVLDAFAASAAGRQVESSSRVRFFDASWVLFFSVSSHRIIFAGGVTLG